MVSSVFVIFDRPSLTSCCFSLHAGTVFPHICQKMPSVGRAGVYVKIGWVIVKKKYLKYIKIVIKSIFLKVYCSICEYCKVFKCLLAMLSLQIVGIWILEIAIYWRAGLPPSSLLSSVKFDFLQNTCTFIKCSWIPSKF